MVLAHLLCPSGAPLLFAVFHTPFSPHAFVRASYLCPSPHFIHYATITPRSYLCDCFITWLPTAAHKCQHTTGSTFHFAKPTLQYSQGFIIASLRPAFISVGFSPPAANNFACLACPPSYVFVMVFRPTTQSLARNKNTRQTLA